MMSPHAPRRLTIATRESALAMWQARHIQTRLQALYPRASIELLGITTQGDQILDRPLSAIDGNGQCIKELEVAIADGRADLAVHSLKDLPTELAAGFVIAAIEAREDPRDALVSNRYATLDALPERAVVAASSLGCEAQLRERFPALDVQTLRGNVEARLRDLDAGKVDAIVLGAVGLRRLGCSDRIRELLDPAYSLPPPGQGALALECLADRTDVVAAVAALNDTATLLATAAERAFSQVLSGNSHTALAAHASWQEGTLWLRGLIASRDGRSVMRAEREAEVIDVDAADALGRKLADDLLVRGAGRLIVND